jgi:DNA-binding NtrC family response regulator
MEPKVLMIGRSQKVIDILITELRNYGRDIIGADNKEDVHDILRNHQIDLVVIGAGLPDEVRIDMKEFIISMKPGLPVNLIERTPDSNPKKMIEFVNQKVSEFKESQTGQ